MNNVQANVWLNNRNQCYNIANSRFSLHYILTRNWVAHQMNKWKNIIEVLRAKSIKANFFERGNFYLITNFFVKRREIHMSFRFYFCVSFQEGEFDQLLVWLLSSWSREKHNDPKETKAIFWLQIANTGWWFGRAIFRLGPPPPPHKTTKIG